MEKKIDIDLVITWVDGNDQNWQREKMKYDDNKKSSNNSIVRYRDWGFLKYFFRGIEKNANWFRKIFFITWGHLPEWINTDNPQLRVVKHKEFIPEDYLPTFNSNVIELNLFRIEDLSEHFVLFNDDMIVVNKLDSKLFFMNEKVCDMLWAKTMVNYNLKSSIWHIVFNNMGIINQDNNGGKNNFRNLSKWINIKYGKRNIDNIMRLPYVRYSSFYDFHLPLAHEKSLFENMWEKHAHELNSTCMNRFRTERDLSHWLMRYQRLATGDFYPIDVTKIGSYYEISSKVNEIAASILKKTAPVIVLNDADFEQERFDEYQNILISAMEAVLPDKSSFEK